MMCGTCQGIEFVRQRDGEDAARAFAQQAVRSYRRGVRQVRGRIFRPQMIAAYVAAKRYLASVTE